MTRILQPELLDTLPPDYPEAEHSRADLRRINAWMGHRRIITRAFEMARFSNVRRIVELGAGDGTLALALATSLHKRWPKVEWTMVDQQKLVTQETVDKFNRLGWQARIVQADVLEGLALETEPADIVLANLFLHHFDEHVLRRILREAAARSSCLVALEPRRHIASRIGCELLWLIGCNRVTRHDARLSVRAGFDGQELSRLWPQTNDWNLRERAAGLFSHLFVARRSST